MQLHGENRTNKYLITALLIGVLFHGTTIFFTLETTYDALIHLFFADHYATHWFEPWSYSWYTGFTVMGYPPLVHQSIALFSMVGGLKFGLFTVALIAIILFITGVYRFSLLLTGNRDVAGYAAVLAVFSSSFLETLHIFGQLPSIVGISVLMHALPEIYTWIRTGNYKYLCTSYSLLAVTVTSHHVTPIFGMVFFIFPLIGMVLMDVAKERQGSFEKVTFLIFVNTLFSLLKRIILFGMGSLVLIIVCILPYWINTKNNPITQVPIPHGSRDHFLEVFSSGLVFFFIPWGILLFIMPYIWYRFFSKRYLFFGLSFTLLSVLGTGGTTPIPRLLLGDTAFDILTLDRFTLWASIMALPMFGEFVHRFVVGDIKTVFQENYGGLYHRIIGGGLSIFYIAFAVFTMSLGYFRPSQPQEIKMLPILNFLKQDQHDHWRYLPLGFGDQMAWLSAQTNAMTVDGNYHSARRLPELTSKAVERLENSKFRGIEGIGSLQQFLTVPEKYHLKYVFSNDKFYDPILYFCGWQRLRQLENGIMVWEKLNIPPLPTILPKADVPTFQKFMWGLIPVLTVLIAFVMMIQSMWFRALKAKKMALPIYVTVAIAYKTMTKRIVVLQHIWAIGLLLIFGYGLYFFYMQNDSQVRPQNVVTAYYDALDFKEFKKAHSFLDPVRKKSIDQYMLEVAVTDGLVSSYAKLDEMEVRLSAETDTTAVAQVQASWITPLEKIERTMYHDVIKRGMRWYVKPAGYDLDIPPDQLMANNATMFYNHGRRRITSEQTYHEDVLKQPVLEVLSAKIVHRDSAYSIIGELQNVDNIPADVVVNGTLYTAANEELASYNAKHQLKHKLVPKEITSFKIDFEETSWLDIGTQKPTVFDPDEFTAVPFDHQPTIFNVQCAGNVATKDLYKDVAVSQLTIEKEHISGVLFNTGIKEVTIPQVLVSFYTAAHQLIWVDHFYLQEGIRSQRKQYFEYPLPDLTDVTLIKGHTDEIYVNGLANKEISKKVVPNRTKAHEKASLLAVDGLGYCYIKIELNAFIGAVD